MNTYRDELRRDNVTKVELVFSSFLKTSTNVAARRKVKIGPKLPLDAYLARLHAAHYVLAPNGDRPECYRHWEAIGLGTVPLTQLDAKRHVHFVGSGAVFENQQWDVQMLQQQLSIPSWNTTRRMVFEEYWMEAVGRSVGRDLRWWYLKGETPDTISLLVARWRERMEQATNGTLPFST